MNWLDHFWPSDRDESADRQTASLGAVAITLFLIVLGLFLVHALHGKAALEDCLMAGRTNCLVLGVP